MANEKQQFIEVGAFWKRVSKKGEKYIKGTINLKNVAGQKDVDIPFVGYTNKQKKEDRHPDFRLYLSQPLNTEAAPKEAESPKASKPAPVAQTQAVDDLL